jgi:hypothetical protein
MADSPKPPFNPAVLRALLKMLAPYIIPDVPRGYVDRAIDESLGKQVEVQFVKSRVKEAPKLKGKTP